VNLRSRLLVGFVLVVLVPMVLLAVGFRHEVTKRLTEEYNQRLDTIRQVVEDDLLRQRVATDERLASLAQALDTDNTFRAALAGVPSGRAYLLDYAGNAMRLTGLSMLQIQDAEGRIVSSGHFRNEHGRVVAGLTAALARQSDRIALLITRAADRDFVALARARPVHIGAQTLTLVGGVIVDDEFLHRLTRDRAVTVSLQYSGGRLSSSAGAEETAASGGPADVAARQLNVPLIAIAADGKIDVEQASLTIGQPRTPLATLLDSVDAWFVFTAVGATVAALLLAVWVSSRVSRPIAELAEKTAVLDLDKLDVQFDESADEVGTLSRVLGDLANRLRTSTSQIREAERRATVGDLARQINHDIKNGLIPLRNVLRHLTQVGRDDPSSLASVLAERRQTIDSSVAYLETLATNYERLAPTPDRRACDVHVLIDDVLRGASGHAHVRLHVDRGAANAHVVGDPIAIRRILENLIANAVDSLDHKPGRITITTRLTSDPATDSASDRMLRIIVEDTGRGMTKEESSRIFTHFYTTKPNGSGLGLSIVRRLVADLHGSVRVESEPGIGTRMIVEMPSAASAPIEDAGNDARHSRQTGSRRRW
jgi:signal transduction histidine kinase